MNEFELQLEKFEKHLDARLDRIESALSVLNTDNKRNSERIAEHNILIAQNKTDVDAMGKITRDMHLKCSADNRNHHEILFTRLGKVENEISFYKGAVFLVPLILSGIYFFINLYVSRG